MTAEDTPSFRHQALPDPQTHIRLLTVWSSQRFDDPVQCDIQIVKLSESAEAMRETFYLKGRPWGCPSYSALSYCWGMNDTGDATLCREIVIGGKKLAVSRNLFEGLLRLRRRNQASYLSATFPSVLCRDPGLLLWVDAVCIDQESVIERSAQVNIMACIYRFASRLLIWLGEGPSEEDDRAVLTLFLCAAQKYPEPWTSIWPHQWQPSPVEVPALHPPQTDHVWAGPEGTPVCACLLAEIDDKLPAKDAESTGSAMDCTENKVMQLETIAELTRLLNLFVSRRYFSRRWVLQEMYYGLERADCEVHWGPVWCSHSKSDTSIRRGLLYTMRLIELKRRSERWEDTSADFRRLSEKHQAAWVLFELHRALAEFGASTPSVVGSLYIATRSTFRTLLGSARDRFSNHISAEAMGGEGFETPLIGSLVAPTTTTSSAEVAIRGPISNKPSAILFDEDAPEHAIDPAIEGLLLMLSHGKRYQCGEPRDRLFALASFSPSLGIVSDYSASMESVCISFARKLIERGYIATAFLNFRQKPRPSSHCMSAEERGASSHERIYLPSWAPDLRRHFLWKNASYGYEQSSLSASFEDDNILICVLGLVATVELPATPDTPYVVVRPAHEQGVLEWMILDAKHFADNLTEDGNLYRKDDCSKDAPRPILLKKGDLLTRLSGQKEWRGEHTCVLRLLDDSSDIYHIVGHVDLCYRSARLGIPTETTVTRIAEIADTKGGDWKEVTICEEFREWTEPVEFREWTEPVEFRIK